jgi:hypothetical protein
MSLTDDALDQLGKLFRENQELRARLADMEAMHATELEKAFRKGWTGCAAHARRETDSLLDEMARDFIETVVAKRASGQGGR